MCPAFLLVSNPLALASHWLEELANYTATAEKVATAAPPALSEALAASQ
jgi:hypothetical protein